MLSFCWQNIMKKWDQFLNEAGQNNEIAKQDIEALEVLSQIIASIIKKRNELGYSQRDLATICGLPQSSIARIESCLVKPNVETLIKIMRPLGLTISVVSN